MIFIGKRPHAIPLAARMSAPNIFPEDLNHIFIIISKSYRDYKICLKDNPSLAKNPS
jgi:hypothetical protein